jgi:hypothetical protein
VPTLGSKHERRGSFLFLLRVGWNALLEKLLHRCKVACSGSSMKALDVTHFHA